MMVIEIQEEEILKELREMHELAGKLRQSAESLFSLSTAKIVEKSALEEDIEGK